MSGETIVVSKRDRTGKGAARDCRKLGLVPAVVYGLGEPPVAVSISAKVLARVLSSETGMNSLLHLQREGTDIKRHAIIKEIQRHPVTGRLTHADFMRVDPTHRVRVHVPIVLKGVPAGVKEGGLLDFIHREIEVECLPAFIPAHIDVNVEHLKMGETLRLDQIQLDSQLTLLGDAHNVICSVHGLKAGDEEAAGGETKEPEVVSTKGKKDDKK